MPSICRKWVLFFYIPNETAHDVPGVFFLVFLFQSTSFSFQDVTFLTFLLRVVSGTSVTSGAAYLRHGCLRMRHQRALDILSSCF